MSHVDIVSKLTFIQFNSFFFLLGESLFHVKARVFLRLKKHKMFISAFLACKEIKKKDNVYYSH